MNASAVSATGTAVAAGPAAEPAAAATIVSCSGLAKRYGEVAALDTIDLTIAPQEMVALVGPDGAGKSTLLKILAGVLRPDGGRVALFGHEGSRPSRTIRREIGYLAQGFTLYGDLSIDENIEFFAEIYGLREYHQHRDELLEFTRLTPFRNRLAGRLSGGMKKKLALACALIHRPQLLLLDEPTTGVDPVTRRDFWVLLGRLLKDEITIVVATPYLDEAERCQRVGLLREGRFLAVGTPEELRGRYDGKLLEVITDETRRARNLVIKAGIPAVREAQTQGDRLHLRIDGDAVPGALRPVLETLFAGAGINITSFRESMPTLENVYLSLIAGGTDAGGRDAGRSGAESPPKSRPEPL